MVNSRAAGDYGKLDGATMRILSTYGVREGLWARAARLLSNDHDSGDYESWETVRSPSAVSPRNIAFPLGYKIHSLGNPEFPSLSQEQKICFPPAFLPVTVKRVPLSVSMLFSMH